MFRRFERIEIFLVLMPTTAVIAVLLLLEFFNKQQLLFSSLASGAFLLYLNSKHPVNKGRILQAALLRLIQQYQMVC